MVRAPSFNPIPHCYIPSPSRLAAFGAFAPLTPSASLRSPSTHPSRIRVAGAGFARHRLPHPPCPGVHTTAGAATHASGRSRSLHTSFPNKTARSVPHPSTPSLTATSLTLTARRLRRLCPSRRIRLATLAVDTPVPLPRRRRGLRPPPASAYPPSPVSTPPRAPLPTPPVADAPCTLPSPTRRHGPCPILQPHPSLLHPLTLTARRLRRLCPSHPLRLAPLAVDTAVPLPRRRCGLRPPPASASPPAPVSTPLRAPLPTPPVARAPSTLPSPTRRYGPGPILQPHPSLLHPPPSRLAAFGAFAPLTPSASLRSPSAPPSHIRVAGAGCARLRLPLPPGSGVRTTAGATTHASGRSRSLLTSFANKAAWSGASSFNPIPRRYIPHPHGSPPSAPLPLSPPPPRSARRRHRRPASASPARASPASGFRIPPAPVSAPPRAPLPTPPVARAPYSLPSPTRPHGPGLILQPHPSPLHPPPSRLAAFGAFAALTPSASLRSPSAPPSHICVAGAGFRPPPASVSPLLRCPHHRQRHYPRLRSLALPPHSLRQQGAMVPASSFNTIPPCYIPSPSRLAAFGAFAALTPPPRSARRRRRCPHHCGRHCRRLRQRASHHCRQLLQQ